MVTQSVWLVFGHDNSKVSVNSCVSSFETHSLFKENDQLISISELFVELNNIFKMIRMNNHMLATFICHHEFFRSDASKANSFPDFRNICLACSFISKIEFFQHNVCFGEQLIVADTLKEDFGCKEKSFIEAAFTTGQNIGLIWIAYKSFKCAKIFFSTFSVSINQLIVDFTIFKGLTCHQ